MKKQVRMAHAIAYGAAAVFLLSLSPPALAKSVMSVRVGQALVVSHTTRLDSLTIADKARLVAPKGHSLTLTVDGVGTAIAPGKYKGKVVLTVTKDIVVNYVPVLDSPYAKPLPPRSPRVTLPTSARVSSRLSAPAAVTSPASTTTPFTAPALTSCGSTGPRNRSR